MVTLSVMFQQQNCKVITVNKKDRDEFNKKNTDKLVTLAVTLKSNVQDTGERHSHYIEEALLAELWGDADE